MPLVLGQRSDELASARGDLKVADQREGRAMDLEDLPQGGEIAPADRAGLIRVVIVLDRGEWDEHQEPIDRAIGPAIADDQPAEVLETTRQPNGFVGVPEQGWPTLSHP